MLEADADSRVHLQRALRAVDAILNDTDPNDLMARTGDPQIDKWLDELEAGKTPDLTEGMDPRFLNPDDGRLTEDQIRRRVERMMPK